MPISIGYPSESSSADENSDPYFPFYWYRYEIPVFSEFSPIFLWAIFSPCLSKRSSTLFSGKISLTLNRHQWRTAH